MSTFVRERRCRACGEPRRRTLLKVEPTALADRLLSEKQFAEAEPMVPLTLVFCERCALVQIEETVRPEILFHEEYPYFSSVVPSLVRHFHESAQTIIDRFELGPSSLVVEAASNDGCMLKNFADQGIRVLGIDPALAPVRVALDSGIKTQCAFFTRELAAQLAADGVQADVFLANNVLAHVADLNGFVEGIGLVLKESGTAVIEVQYVADLVEKCGFDMIYHQHLCFFSLTVLERLFRRHRLYVNDVQRVATQGGSLRVFVQKRPNRQESVRNLLEWEQRTGLDGPRYFEAFAGRVETLCRDLKSLIESLRRQGFRIAAYGAAAKGTTLLQHTEIGSSHLDYVVDLSPHKQGLYMGGTHLPIRSPDVLLEDQPDFLLLLAWNYAGEIMNQQAEYARRGGRFIIPVPEPVVLPQLRERAA